MVNLKLIDEIKYLKFRLPNIKLIFNIFISYNYFLHAMINFTESTINLLKVGSQETKYFFFKIGHIPVLYKLIYEAYLMSEEISFLTLKYINYIIVIL